jgi:hypothetical protein
MVHEKNYINRNELETLELEIKNLLLENEDE